MQLLDAQDLVDLEARDGPDGLDETLGLDLLALLRVRAQTGQSLDLVDDALHQPVVACQEVDVGDAEHGLLRDVRERVVRVRLNGVGRPDVEVDEVVHLLEALQQDIPGDGEVALADHPRHDFHAAEVPLAAHDDNLFDSMLDQGTDIFYCERAMAVEDNDLTFRLGVVDSAVRGVLDVSIEDIFPRKLERPQVVQVPGPCHDRGGHEQLPGVVGVRRQGCQRVVGEARQDLDLLHRQVEHGLLVQPVLRGLVSEHPEQLVAGWPRRVPRVAVLLRALRVFVDVADPVASLFCLQLRELVGHQHPGRAAEVVELVDAHEVLPAALLKEDGCLDAAEPRADDHGRVGVLLGGALEALDAERRHSAGTFVVDPLGPGEEADPRDQAQLARVPLAVPAQNVADFRGCCRARRPDGDGLSAILVVDLDDAGLLPACDDACMCDVLRRGAGRPRGGTVPT
mmetsp:Transcript_79610/g.225373  ORF Transcript_79610/g.225373 Transcript_79610/m.225373 type:complete len:455 (-) Transcript_79610:84-1448(-)